VYGVVESGKGVFAAVVGIIRLRRRERVEAAGVASGSKSRI
jgi:hypothetical protein